jgi:large subunit ribosomal protein L13
MKNLTKSTKSISEKELKPEWHLINMEGKILGRTTPKIAILLMGKHKTNYVSYLDSGDSVVVINAQKVVLTGKKSLSKIYSYYSGYPSGLRKVSFEKMIEKNPTEVVRRAVSGMLPKNKLRDRRLARLFIYADDKHPYEEKFKVQKSKVNIKKNAEKN